jgi:hypothetical protein
MVLKVITLEGTAFQIAYSFTAWVNVTVKFTVKKSPVPLGAEFHSLKV